MTTDSDTLQIVGPRDQFPKVSLIPPTSSGYLMLAIEVDHRPPLGFFMQSQAKTRLIRDLKKRAQRFREKANILNVAIFKALIIPPGRGAHLKKRPNIEIARFDVVMLIECVDLDTAQKFKESPDWTETLEQAHKVARKILSFAASNTRHIGPVDHSRNGVFLFNYFYADNLDINLKVWNYTAGWFQDQTGLDNSTVLLPQQSPNLHYTIINHCRWDRLRDILPAILFNRSFRPFVLANFLKNKTAAMPILYQLA